MTRIFAILSLVLFAQPGAAASGPFFSLANTDFVVLLAFILFIVLLVYFKIPGLLVGLLDKRAEGIRSELDEARALRDEAQVLLASFERKQGEVKEQANRIVEQAKEDAAEAAEAAKQNIADSIARRVQAAEDRIASAEAKAIRQVRNQAIAYAVRTTNDVVAAQMDQPKSDALFEAALDDVKKQLH